MWLLRDSNRHVLGDRNHPSSRDVTPSHRPLPSVRGGGRADRLCKLFQGTLAGGNGDKFMISLKVHERDVAPW